MPERATGPGLGSDRSVGVWEAGDRGASVARAPVNVEPPAATVANLLLEARAAGVARLDAQALLTHVLGRPRSWLIAHDDAPLAPGPAAAVRAGLARRAAGEPLAYVLGEKEFYGLMLEVGPDVLVPRPETELLVDWALELLGGELARLPAPHVVDLGTGSGAIAIAVKHRHPAAAVSASDESAAALSVARRNAQRCGVALAWHQGPWWDALGNGRFDLVLANPPYIAGGDRHLGALRHEPALALTPGGDGLSALRALVAGAPGHLNTGGVVVLEHGFDQADAVRLLFDAHGFEPATMRRDAAGHPRCTAGRWR